MIGATPGYIVAVRPLRGGAITDFEITERMIRLLLQRVGVSRFTRPKVVICVPSAITEVERRAVTDAAAAPVPRRAADRAADGRGDRRRPAHRRAGRQHGHRHRWRHAARRRSSASAESSRWKRCGSAASTSTPRSRTTCAASTASPSASARRKRSRSRSVRPTPTGTRTQAEVRGRDLMSGSAEDRAARAGGDPLRDRRRRVAHRVVGGALPRQGAAESSPQDFLVRGMYLVGGGGLLRGLAQRIERETEGAGAHVADAARSGRARRRPLHRALRSAQGHVHGRPRTLAAEGAATVGRHGRATTGAAVRDRRRARRRHHAEPTRGAQRAHLRDVRRARRCRPRRARQGGALPGDHRRRPRVLQRRRRAPGDGRRRAEGKAPAMSSREPRPHTGRRCAAAHRHPGHRRRQRRGGRLGHGAVGDGRHPRRQRAGQVR